MVLATSSYHDCQAHPSLGKERGGCSEPSPYTIPLCLTSPQRRHSLSSSTYCVAIILLEEEPQGSLITKPQSLKTAEPYSSPHVPEHAWGHMCTPSLPQSAARWEMRCSNTGAYQTDTRREGQSTILLMVEQQIPKIQNKN